jgi:hypothetical protein
MKDEEEDMSPPPGVDLKANCPHCGRPFEGGYGRLRSQVRGFWPNSRRPIGIYGRKDVDITMCRRRYQFVEQALDTVRYSHNDGFDAGYSAGLAHGRTKKE